jgi:hypothetical protein
MLSALSLEEATELAFMGIWVSWLDKGIAIGLGLVAEVADRG